MANPIASTARVDPDLVRTLSGDPRLEVEAILTANASLDELVASLPPDVHVHYRYALIRGVAVSAPAGTLRHLAESPVVKSIEPVRDVSAQGAQGSSAEPSAAPPKNDPGSVG